MKNKRSFFVCMSFNTRDLYFLLLLYAEESHVEG